MIDFISKSKLYFIFSGLFVGVSIFSLVVWGLKPSIDFTGGALLEVDFTDELQLDSSEIMTSVNEVEGYDASSIQVLDGNSIVIRSNSIDETKKNEVLTKLSSKDQDLIEVRFESVGPTLGKELLVKTGVAILVASILIMGYVTYQFKDRVYGLSAILAMLHDTIILIGAFSLFGHFLNVEVDVLFVTALLTTLSFSVHDTIVVFDRIRENVELTGTGKINQIINQAVMETLPRSLNNSMTIIFMLTALALLGGDTIRWFVVALLIGTVSGTYSSTFTAAPLLSLLIKRRK